MCVYILYIYILTYTHTHICVCARACVCEWSKKEDSVIYLFMNVLFPKHFHWSVWFYSNSYLSAVGNYSRILYNVQFTGLYFPFATEFQNVVRIGKKKHLLIWFRQYNFFYYSNCFYKLLTLSVLCWMFTRKYTFHFCKRRRQNKYGTKTNQKLCVPKMIIIVSNRNVLIVIYGGSLRYDT